MQEKAIKPIKRIKQISVIGLFGMFNHVIPLHTEDRILSLGLTKAIGTHNTKMVTPEIVEKLLRLAYERSYFAKTQVYLLVRQWEQNNVPFVILSVE